MRQPETPLCTVLERGRVVGFGSTVALAGFESFDADERSLGVFDTRHRAISAVREFRSDASR